MVFSNALAYFVAAPDGQAMGCGYDIEKEGTSRLPPCIRKSLLFGLLAVYPGIGLGKVQGLFVQCPATDGTFKAKAG